MVSLQTGSSTDSTQDQLDSFGAANATLQDQINAEASVAGTRGKRMPFGRPNGSMVARAVSAGLAVSVSVGGKQTEEVIIPKVTTPDDVFNVTTFTTSAVDATTDDIPDGSWGWHFNTATSKMSLMRNEGGVLYAPTGSSIGFVDITGTISDGQHGLRAGGTLHSNATALVSGFMSSAQFTKLGNYPADCTDTTSAADSNALQRVAGRARANVFDGLVEYRCAGTQVVTTRRTGYQNFTSITFLRDISAIDFSGPPIFADGAVGGTTNFRMLCRFVAAIASDIGVTHHGLTDCN